MNIRTKLKKKKIHNKLMALGLTSGKFMTWHIDKFFKIKKILKSFKIKKKLKKSKNKHVICKVRKY